MLSCSFSVSSASRSRACAPLQCRSQGKDGFPGSQRTTSIKPDSGGFEAGKFHPDDLDLIRGNAHADVLQSLLPFPVKRDACPLASRQ